MQRRFQLTALWMAKDIVIAWVVTMPMAALAAAPFYALAKRF
jgi:phosphate/sulfate permease